VEWAGGEAVNDKHWQYTLVIPFTLLFVFLATMCLIKGFDNGTDQMQQQAVIAGHAEWVADKSGKPQFKWKECK
jgi:hypothetical protein